MTAPLSGFRIAAAAMRGNERRMEVVANNLANVSTDGFKAERTFAHLLEGLQGAPTVGSRADLSTGTLHDTADPLDLAIAGDGFLVVDSPDGERWTRGGRVTVDQANRLTMGGAALLGESGPITLPALWRQLSVGRDGTVLADGVAFGRLRMERPGDRSQLLRGAQGRLDPGAAGRVAIAPERRDLRQGALESSNVEPTSEMVEMLTIQRHHAILERAISTIDGARDGAVTSLAKPA